MNNDYERKIFKNVSYEELKFLYQQILAGRKDGLRPKCLDTYIYKIQEIYPMTFADAWTYVENLFWNEVGERYFEDK